MLLDAAVYGLDHWSPMSASRLIIRSTQLLATCFFLKLLTLIMFMDAVVGWVLDVSLSEQETCTMLSYFVPYD
jgi:hypothetical protein